MERVRGIYLPPTAPPVEPEQASAGDDDGRPIRRVISNQRVQKAQRTERSGDVVPAETMNQAYRARRRRDRRNYR